jgi:hypothetical protein
MKKTKYFTYYTKEDFLTSVDLGYKARLSLFLGASIGGIDEKGFYLFEDSIDHKVDSCFCVTKGKDLIIFPFTNNEIIKQFELIRSIKNKIDNK